MYGKTHTTSIGEVIPLDKLTNQHLLNTATFYQNKYDGKLLAPSTVLPRLYNVVEEIEDRVKKEILDEDEWEGYTLIHCKQLLQKHCLPLPLKPAMPFIPPHIKLPPDTIGYPKEVRRLKKEEEEKLWQETEQRILPEGDRDKIEATVFCFVDKITRRLYIDPLEPNGNLFKLPKFITKQMDRMDLIGKKCKVTIEVLED